MIFAIDFKRIQYFNLRLIIQKQLFIGDKGHPIDKKLIFQSIPNSLKVLDERF